MQQTAVNVLLVDDDEEEFLIMRDHVSDIAGTPYNLDWCADYPSAMREISGERHDLYLVDYRLGAENGLDLIEQARAGGVEKPFILLTGQGDRAVDVEAMRRGAADYLVKQDTNSIVLERSMRYALERRRSAEELNRMANYDSLTGLPNRNLLFRRLGDAVRRAWIAGETLALIILDLDHFADINGSLGYDAGDRMLQKTADRLQAVCGKADTLARLDGDKFAIMLAHIGDIEHVTLIAEQLLQGMCEPFLFSGRAARSSCSMGISLFPKEADNAETLFRNADFALVQAKAAGRKTFCFFESGAQEALAQRIAIANDLQPALDRSEFRLVYQPVVNVRTGEIVSLEALARWKHPTRGEIGPAQFVPIAESTGMITQVGEWVLHEACRQVKVWLDQGIDVRVAVNLSPRQIQSLDVPELVAKAIRRAGITSNNLAMEVTEGLLVEDSEANILMLERLRKMGVRVYLDDFGVGYSSLSYLRRFPVTALKIDSSFINEITTGTDGQMIIKAIIGLAHNLGLDVIAEGVETEQQKQFLLAEGCETHQGYLLSRPIEADHLASWYQKFNLDRLKTLSRCAPVNKMVNAKTG